MYCMFYHVHTAYLFFKGRVRRALTPENGTAIPASLRWKTLEEIRAPDSNFGEKRASRSRSFQTAVSSLRL